MIERKILIHNLYRQFEKDKWNIENILLGQLNEIAIATKKDNKKITMIIKIEEEEKK